MTDLTQLSDENLLALYRQLKPQRTAQPAGGVMDSPFGGFVRGLRDPIDAGAQMLVRALPDSVVAAGDALGNKLADLGLPVARSNNTGMPGAPNVDEINRQAEQDYQQNWRGGQSPGVDLSRIAGNIVGTLPAARLFPMGAASTLGRIGQGAAAGSALATLQPVDAPDDFWAQKAIQSVAGAIFGGVGAPIGNLIGKGVGMAAQKASQGLAALRNRGDLAVNANLDARVDSALRAAGFDLGAVPAGVRESLRVDVAKAMSAGQDISPAAVSRMADARAVGVTLTRGQASRDPGQYQFEQNTRGVVGAGEPLQQRFAEQNAQLVRGVGEMASTQSPYQAGVQLTTALRGTDQALNAKVGEAYQAARARVGSGTEIPPQLLAQKAGEVLETYGPENVPGVVIRRLQSYGLLGGEQTKSFTVDEADRLRKVINANYDPTRKAEAAALNAIRGGIDDAENALAGQTGQIGQEAAQAFERARKLAAGRFNLLDQVDALKAAAEGAEPDKFVAKYIVNAPVGQVRGLKAVLNAADPALVAEMRGQVVAYLKARAVNGADDEFAKFSQSAYRKALSEIGPEKLSTLFTPQERFKLLALGRTASAIQVPPAGAAVNGSNTGATVFNLLSRIPYANAVMRPVQSALADARVSTALQPTVGAGPRPVPEYVRRLAQQGGLLGTTTGSLFGGLAGS